MVAGFASVLEKQACGTVLSETTQQTKYLTPMQADQFARVGYAQPTRSNPQQDLKPTQQRLDRRHRVDPHDRAAGFRLQAWVGPRASGTTPNVGRLANILTAGGAAVVPWRGLRDRRL